MIKVVTLSDIKQLASNQLAYLLVHSRAVAVYLARSVLYWLAMSGTRGSSGLASVSRELIDKSTFEIVSAGDH